MEDWMAGGVAAVAKFFLAEAVSAAAEFAQTRTEGEPCVGDDLELSPRSTK